MPQDDENAPSIPPDPRWHGQYPVTPVPPSTPAHPMHPFHYYAYPYPPIPTPVASVPPVLMQTPSRVPDPTESTPVRASQSKTQSQPSAPQRAAKKTEAQKLEQIFNLLDSWQWSLSKLLFLLFSPMDKDGKPMERSETHIRRIAAFLTGVGKYNASHIVSYWYSERYSQPAASHPEHNLAFSLDTPPTEINYARPGLSAWAASICMHKIDLDAKRATKPLAGLHVRTRTSARRRELAASTGEAFTPMKWSDVNSDVLSTARRVFQGECGLLWGFMSHAARQAPEPNQVVAVRQYRPVEHVVTGALSDLLFSRNSSANLVPLARGVAYFATRAEQSIMRLGSRFGTNPAYSTVIRALKTLGEDGERWLQSAAESDIIWLMLIIDNVQHFGRQREIRDGRESFMHKGVTGTGVLALNVKPHAWSLQQLLASKSGDARYSLTVDDLMAKIDFDWVHNIGWLHWVDALLSNADPRHVSKLKDELEELFQSLAKSPVLPEDTHSNIQPLRSNSCDPAQNTEMAKALHDFFCVQLNQTPERWKQRAVMIGGDGGTYETLLRLQKYLQSLPTVHERLAFLIPILQMWHTKWTALGRNVNNFWDKTTSQDVSSLGHSNTVAKRPPPANLKKPDFHSATELFYLVGETRMIDCWSINLGEDDIPGYFARLHREGKLPSLESLLERAKKLYWTYSCSKAGALALEPYSDQPISCRAPLWRDLPPEAESDPADTATAVTPQPLPAAAPRAEDETDDAPFEHSAQADEHAADSIAGSDPEAVATTLNETSSSEHREESQFAGDRCLSNSIRMLTDFIHYRHWCRSTSLGNAGDLWEIFKLEGFKFAGSGHNPKYREFSLEMFIFVEFECTPELREAIISNLLVNPSGRKGHFKEGDLLQEHLINRLDRHMQHRDKSYDDPFIRDVVTPNLHHFIEVPRQLESAVDLEARSARHKSMHQRSEAVRLRALYRRTQLHRFCAGRTSNFAAKDCMAVGLDELERKWLTEFLARHRRETNVLHRETPASHADRRQAAATRTASNTGTTPSTTGAPPATSLHDLLASAGPPPDSILSFLEDVPTYGPDDELGAPVSDLDLEMVFDAGGIAWESISEQLNALLGEFSEGSDGFGTDSGT